MCVNVYCDVQHCTVQHCTVLYCTVLYCTVLYCTVLYCNVLYCTVLCCTVLYCTVSIHFIHVCLQRVNKYTTKQAGTEMLPGFNESLLNRLRPAYYLLVCTHARARARTHTHTHKVITEWSLWICVFSVYSHSSYHFASFTAQPTSDPQHLVQTSSKCTTDH